MSRNPLPFTISLITTIKNYAKSSNFSLKEEKEGWDYDKRCNKPLYHICFDHNYSYNIFINNLRLCNQKIINNTFFEIVFSYVKISKIFT